MLNLPTPRPIRLDKISPTLASDLFACPYRVAWRLDDRFRYLQRPTPFAILGVVAHGVAEDVSKGALSGAVDDAEARRRLAAAWDSHVAEGLQLLRERWAPAMPRT